MFAAAMLTEDYELKETAIKKFAESNKKMWHIENAGYFLLQLVDQIEKNELLSAAIDKQYGIGRDKISGWLGRRWNCAYSQRKLLYKCQY